MVWPNDQGLGKNKSGMWSGKYNVDRAVSSDPEAEPTVSHVDALQNALSAEEVLSNQVDMIIHPVGELTSINFFPQLVLGLLRNMWFWRQEERPPGGVRTLQPFQS